MISLNKIITLLCCLSLQQFIIAQSSVQKDFTKPAATEIWDQKPKIITPAVNGAPPSDAIILFNGRDTDAWLSSKDSSRCKWDMDQESLTIVVGSGNIKTKQLFGDCQLHLEFRIPADSKSSKVRDNAGNSGIFMQQRYEVQIFDSYLNETLLYSNGITGSIYKQVIPMANAAARPGEWNTYDIYYTAPKFRFNGTVEQPAFITVVNNNILLLNHFEIQGSTQHTGIPRYEVHGKASIELQEHNSAVSFRNIWVREL